MGGYKFSITLLCAVLVSGLAALIPLAWIGARTLSSSYRESAARETTSSARMLALALASGETARSPGELARRVRQAREASGARFTIIGRDGTVIADSDENADRMENHLNRPEVQAAIAGGAGSAGMEIRSSPTLGTEWMYVAITPDDGVIIRAALSMDQLNSRLGQWWRRSLAAFAISLSVLIAMAIAAARRISRPLEEAAAGAEQYAQGDFSYRIPIGGSAETRKLSKAMGVMAAELDVRFKLIDRQREEMRTVFENMSDGVLAVDNEGKLMLANPTAESLLELPADAQGKGIELMSRNVGILSAISDTIASDAQLEREFRLLRGDGSESLVQLHTARIREGGTAKGVLVVMRDITRVRQLEIMRRDFVANVSHELRTPITAIQSCLETVMDDLPDDGENGEFLEMALRNTRRMGAIIDSLLFLAGMESGRNQNAGRVTVCPIEPIIEEAVSLCKTDAAQRKISIAVRCEPDLHALVNPQLTMHAIANLLDNAIKYGNEGGGIDVAAIRNGDKVHISVTDQGPGIAPRYQDRVFERFFRVDGTGRIKKGSGLGLAIVKHIALAQGGSVELESEIGVGSRFILTVPYGAAVAEAR